MKAMIFAAGKGTRLKPLTDDTPKALVKFKDKTLLEHAILKLKNAGVTSIIINVHYLSNQIIDFLKKNKNFGLEIDISNEKDLLDTGGGLKKASSFFSDNNPFILYNTDVISTINLVKMLEYHHKKKSVATLAVRERESGRYLLFNENMRLCGWKNVKTGELKISKKADKNESLAFSGIHIINPYVFKYFPKENIFSIIDFYLELAKKEAMFGFNHSSDLWFDIGSVEKLKNAEKKYS